MPVHSNQVRRAIASPADVASAAAVEQARISRRARVM